MSSLYTSSNVGVLKSYEDMRNAIVQLCKIQNSDIPNIPAVQHVKRNNKGKIEEKQIIPAIPNNCIIRLNDCSKLINVILSCQKMTFPISYIFTECQYVSIIIKSPKDFPLEIIRMPIDNIKVYSKQDNNVCFEFQARGIQKTNVKLNKHVTFNIDYIIDDEIKMVYSVNMPDEINPLKETYNAIGTPDINTINEIFGYIDGFGENKNYIFQLFNMPIIILRKIPHTMNSHVIFRFIKTGSANNINPDKNNFIIINTKDECGTYVNKSIKGTSENPLFCRDDSLIWKEISNFINCTDNIIELRLLPATQMFKHSINKSVSASDNIYYILGYFNSYFVFMKVISKVLIKNAITKDVTYSELFTHDTQFIELYMLEYIPQSESNEPEQTNMNQATNFNNNYTNNYSQNQSNEEPQFTNNISADKRKKNKVKNVKNNYSQNNYECNETGNNYQNNYQCQNEDNYGNNYSNNYSNE
jgi:hypothetical protein